MQERRPHQDTMQSVLQYSQAQGLLQAQHGSPPPCVRATTEKDARSC